MKALSPIRRKFEQVRCYVRADIQYVLGTLKDLLSGQPLDRGGNPRSDVINSLSREMAKVLRA